MGYTVSGSGIVPIILGARPLIGLVNIPLCHDNRRIDYSHEGERKRATTVRYKKKSRGQKGLIRFDIEANDAERLEGQGKIRVQPQILRLHPSIYQPGGLAVG